MTKTWHDSTLEKELANGFVPLDRMTNGGLVLIRRDDYDPMFPRFRVTVAGGSFCDAPADTNCWAVPEIQLSDHGAESKRSLAQYKVGHGSGGGRPARERGELLIMLCDFVDEINAEMQVMYAEIGAEYKARYEQWDEARWMQHRREALQEFMAEHPEVEIKETMRVAKVLKEPGYTRVLFMNIEGDELSNNGTTKTVGDARKRLAQEGGGILINGDKITNVRAKVNA